MRVLHVYNIHRGGGGSDTATAATIGVLRQRGVEVDTFTRDSRDLPVSLAGKVRAFASGLYAAEAVQAFTRQIEQRRPDLVHVHELYPLISPWVLPRCQAAGIAVVMTCNDFRLSCPIATHYTAGAPCYKCLDGKEYWCMLRNCRTSLPESLSFALRNASARRARLFDEGIQRFIAISRYQLDFMSDRLGMDRRRLSLNPCAIDLPETPVDDPAQGGYVAYAGRFVPEKGIEVMVAACRLADLPMRFAGDAPSHPAVAPDDQAEFVMTRSPADLAAFYRGARMLVVPSVWPETFGIVAAEAMGHGIPVVASRIGGLQGNIRDGESGLLAEPGNVADFADKIARVWADPELARRLGRGARDHALQLFSHQSHFDRLMRIYQAVLDEQAGTTAPGRLNHPSSVG